MVKQLYHIDSYLKEFEATIENIISEGVVLDQTAFYPGGGGQPCDFGILTSNGIDYKVDKVQYSEGTIIHKVSSEGLNIGDKIFAKIDLTNKQSGQKEEILATPTQKFDGQFF